MALQLPPEVWAHALTFMRLEDVKVLAQVISPDTLLDVLARVSSDKGINSELFIAIVKGLPLGVILPPAFEQPPTTEQRRSMGRNWWSIGRHQLTCLGKPRQIPITCEAGNENVMIVPEDFYTHGHALVAIETSTECDLMLSAPQNFGQTLVALRPNKRVTFDNPFPLAYNTVQRLIIKSYTHGAVVINATVVKIEPPWDFNMIFVNSYRTTIQCNDHLYTFNRTDKYINSIDIINIPQLFGQILYMSFDDASIQYISGQWVDNDTYRFEAPALFQQSCLMHEIIIPGGATLCKQLDIIECRTNMIHSRSGEVILRLCR